MRVCGAAVSESKMTGYVGMVALVLVIVA